MNLRFNKNGDIATDTEGLLEVEELEAELGRFLMFFDTRRGGYKYASSFGNNSSSIVGQSNVSVDDILLFNEDLKSYLSASNLFDGFDISGDFIDQHTIKLDLIGGGNEAVSWHYSTKNGRLTAVEDTTPETEFSFIIHSREWKSTGNVEYDIIADINKVKEINSIGLYDELNLSHRMFILDGPGRSGDQVDSYEINDIAGTLELNPPVQPDLWIRLELWPSNSANIEKTDNPYLMRRNL